jgi:hypothetical protein
LKVRSDLKDVEPLVSRLLSIGREFAAKDSKWSQLKNNEDWSKIHGIDDLTAKGHIEDVYSTGRDMCLFMSEALLSINSDFATYPTLTSIIDRFEETWVYEDLGHTPTSAKSAAEAIEFNNWAFGCMLAEFHKQLELLLAVRNTLRMLKASNLYRQENRMPVPDATVPINISLNNISNSAVAIHSANATQSVHREEAIFRNLIRAVEAAPIANKGEVIAAVKEMESSYRTESWLTSYKNFMSVAADHLQVLQPFIPALAAML